MEKTVEKIHELKKLNKRLVILTNLGRDKEAREVIKVMKLIMLTIGEYDRRLYAEDLEKMLW